MGADRTGDAGEILDAIAAARDATNDHPYWRTVLIIVLAGLVDDEATPSELLSWTMQDSMHD